MKVLRKMKIDTDEFIVGDQINVGYYTATCQKVEADGYIFLLDQYLDDTMQMNSNDTNEGGYEKSDLIKRLNSTEILDIFVFGDVSNMLVPFEDGALFRLPFYGEMFGHDGLYRYRTIEPDDYEQWELMRDRRNRIAEHKGESYEWGVAPEQECSVIDVFLRCQQPWQCRLLGRLVLNRCPSCI